jgi:hypothetical protein
MAKIDKNLLVRGARGHVGKQLVYQKRGGDTFLVSMPSKNEGPSTEKQEHIRELFMEAAAYAKGAIANAELKKEYQRKAKGRTSAYNIAFRDYLKAPVVSDIDTATYNGHRGSTIVISAKDDFRVVDVTVHIRTAAGVLVEEGKAVLNPINRNKWIFVAEQDNAALSGSIITATASDLPGNKATLEVTLK